MSINTSFSGNQEPYISMSIYDIQEQHRAEMESVIEALANITSLSPDRVKPYVDSMLKQLIKESVEQPPFYETATAEEWVKAFRAWAEDHHHNAPPLSDYAVSRESMYEDEQL